jgi:cell division protein ZapE
MALLDTYRSLVAQGAIVPDAAQESAARRLDALARQLRTWRRREGLAALLRGSQPAPKGLYIFGAVGRGKTMLMDLFFEATSFRPKRRVHFHEFMAEVHDHIAAARKLVPGDPLPQVARHLAHKARLLCFDELHVTDIADAMILSRLFKSLFDEQVVVVATSNVAPGELYRDGLNRALFLPFIDLIAAHMDIEQLEAAKDFRLDKLAGRPLFFTPADGRAKAEMDRLWGELTGNRPGAAADLEVKGRKLRVPAAAMGVARFSFAELCDKPLGANDYLHIAHAFHTLLIDAIPLLAGAPRDVTRRFINLIDTLYDNRVCLVASAAAEPQSLYGTGDMAYLFERTASRLIEMRSQGYLTGRKDRLAVRTGADTATPAS